jgi:hypothetical protein
MISFQLLEVFFGVDHNNLDLDQDSGETRRHRIWCP